jgi:hypothetical protein
MGQKSTRLVRFALQVPARFVRGWDPPMQGCSSEDPTSSQTTESTSTFAHASRPGGRQYSEGSQLAGSLTRHRFDLARRWQAAPVRIPTRMTYWARRARPRLTSQKEDDYTTGSLRSAPVGTGGVRGSPFKDGVTRCPGAPWQGVGARQRYFGRRCARSHPSSSPRFSKTFPSTLM